MKRRDKRANLVDADPWVAPEHARFAAAMPRDCLGRLIVDTRPCSMVPPQAKQSDVAEALRQAANRQIREEMRR